MRRIHKDIPLYGDCFMTIGDKKQEVKGGYFDLFLNGKEEIELCIKNGVSIEYGKEECDNCVSIYHNCLLLAFDMRYNKISYEKIPPIRLDNGRIDADIVKVDVGRIAYSVKTIDEETIMLVDFESAGQAGSYYNTWIPINKEKNYEN